MAIITTGILAHLDAGKTSLTERSLSLINTLGHTDFVSEVGRSPRVLDDVVLVVSAVEGAPAQTRRRARAGPPADLAQFIFVNKVDRLGIHGETRRFPCTVFGR